MSRAHICILKTLESSGTQPPPSAGEDKRRVPHLKFKPVQAACCRGFRPSQPLRWNVAPRRQRLINVCFLSGSKIRSVFCTHVSAEVLISQHGTSVHVHIVFCVWTTQWAFCTCLLLFYDLTHFAKMDPWTQTSSTESQRPAATGSLEAGRRPDIASSHWTKAAMGEFDFATNTVWFKSSVSASFWVVFFFFFQDTELLDIAYIKDARNGKCTKTPKVSCTFLLLIDMKYWIKKRGLLSL